MRKWKKWLKYAMRRAVKTMAQTFLAVAGTSFLFTSADWKMILVATVSAGVLSMVTSIAGLPELENPYNDDKGQNEEGEG